MPLRINPPSNFSGLNIIISPVQMNSEKKIGGSDRTCAAAPDSEGGLLPCQELILAWITLCSRSMTYVTTAGHLRK
jgi:hypothetical protein